MRHSSSTISLVDYVQGLVDGSVSTKRLILCVLLYFDTILWLRFSSISWSVWTERRRWCDEKKIPKSLLFALSPYFTNNKRSNSGCNIASAETNVLVTERRYTFVPRYTNTLIFTDTQCIHIAALWIHISHCLDKSIVISRTQCGPTLPQSYRSVDFCMSILVYNINIIMIHHLNLLLNFGLT